MLRKILKKVYRKCKEILMKFCKLAFDAGLGGDPGKRVRCLWGQFAMRESPYGVFKEKLGIYTKFIEKLCKFFVQLMDRRNFEEF